MKLLMIRLDQFVKIMIKPQNKNYSFIAISKHSKSKKRSMNIGLNKIFSPSSTFYNQKDQDSQLHLSYISPDAQQLNSFKHKLSIYLNRNPYLSKQHLPPTDKTELFSMTQTFKTAKKCNETSINRWYSQGAQKKRNIKQYICQISHEKRKFSANKTLESDFHAIKQQQYRSNQLVIIRKLNRPKDKKDLTNIQTNNIFKYRNIPIHHTQVHYFSKQKSNTEPAQLITDPNTSQKSKEAEVEEKKKVTISRIFRLREQLNLKRAQKISQNAAKQLLIINEIHPTVAIITTRKSQNKNSSLQERQMRVSCKNNRIKTTKSKEEEEISPWKRRNQNEFEFF